MALIRDILVQQLNDPRWVGGVPAAAAAAAAHCVHALPLLPLLPPATGVAAVAAIFFIQTKNNNQRVSISKRPQLWPALPSTPHSSPPGSLLASLQMAAPAVLQRCCSCHCPPRHAGVHALSSTQLPGRQRACLAADDDPGRAAAVLQAAGQHRQRQAAAGPDQEDAGGRRRGGGGPATRRQDSTLRGCSCAGRLRRAGGWAAASLRASPHCNTSLPGPCLSSDPPPRS